MKVWIYHKENNPKVINRCQLRQFKKDGWSDDPCKFVNLVKDFGIDLDAVDSQMLIQQAGESVVGVKDYLNNLLNINILSRKLLIKFAKDNFGIELEGKNRKKILRQILDKIDEMELELVC